MFNSGPRPIYVLPAHPAYKPSPGPWSIVDSASFCEKDAESTVDCGPEEGW